MKKRLYWMSMLAVSLLNGVIFYIASGSAMNRGIDGVDNQAGLLFIPIFWILATFVLVALNTFTWIHGRKIARNQKIALFDLFRLSKLSAKEKALRAVFAITTCLLMLFGYSLFAAEKVWAFFMRLREASYFGYCMPGTKPPRKVVRRQTEFVLQGMLPLGNVLLAGRTEKRPKKSAAEENRRRFYAAQTCKPGSVLTAIYLAPELLPGSSRLLGMVGPTMYSSTALLRDRVYSTPMSPWGGCALTTPFHYDQMKLATSLCCTCPEVALGGRYPLSLALRSPDFPHPRPFGLRPRLSGLAAKILYSRLGRLSNYIANSF